MESIFGYTLGELEIEGRTLTDNYCSYDSQILLQSCATCDVAWSSLLQQDQDRLQRLQNRSARIIARCARSAEAMESLRWSLLPLRRSYHKAILVFLSLHSLVPDYFLSYFTRFSNVLTTTLETAIGYLCRRWNAILETVLSIAVLNCLMTSLQASWTLAICKPCLGWLGIYFLIK